MLPVFLSPVVTILQCGASRAALGVFQLNGRQLRCIHFAAKSIPTGSGSDDSWLEHTAAALRTLNDGRRRARPVVLVLPAHLTLTKQIKVPRVESAKRAQVIRFEAEQAIPHALADVRWDCVVSGQRDTEEDRVLVAAKRETIDQLCSTVQAAGFEPCQVLPVSLVTLAAFRLAQPALTQPVLILNIDGRSTTVLQVEGSRFAVRNLAQGGVAGGQQSAEHPVGEPAEATQSFIARLAPEISRSVLHFAREAGFASPVEVFLTSSGARLAGLDGALAARLKLPVAYFDARSVVEMGSGCAAGESVMSAFTELSGAAAITLLPSQPTMDLLPPALRRWASLRRRQPWLLAAALLIVAALAPPIIHFRQLTAAARTKMGALEKSLVPLRERDAHIRASLAQLQQIRVRLAQLQSVRERRTAWLQLLAGLQERLVEVEDVWLEKLQAIPSVEGSPMRLAISGCMLDRAGHGANDGAETNNRVKALLAGIADLPGVSAIEGERFDHSQPGLLRFDFILAPAPAHPL